ncbi:PP2C family serine/threonine-protein phosphatase [Sulfitobacter sp. S190]|uniref:PP2C family protein-serine/threonine phosphatase n=1 Tax=Sulfitobacter sp. S190 TaxID=2867022 RepID=UPI0021A4545C|nr:protein phosphatase 2C domain-containing protein [Sulfitobacter sp. S190]UWR21188.1 protein phosphatase 2C domain-containing protein [Sulfitobacter sp. S190]
MTTFRYGTATHTGWVRAQNDDRLIALPHHRIWAVADGMGGHRAGGRAAQTVVDCIAGVPRSPDPEQQIRALRGAIQKAHDILLEQSRAGSGGIMGTTVATFMASDNCFWCDWAGDSRVYCVRDGTLRQLTADHSVVADLVALGELSWPEARHHPQRHVVKRAVGAQANLDLGTVTGTLRQGDRYVLSTDGLHNALDLEAILGDLRDTPSEEVAETLLKAALDGEGEDNITVIVIDVA